MGADIHIAAQRREGDRWVDVKGRFTEGSAPFDWRSYSMFGFLADVRNYSCVPPIAEPRGLPDDLVSDPMWEDVSGASWLTVRELSDFDYDQTFEDRRVSREIAPGLFHGAVIAELGGGVRITFREFLLSAFFDDLGELQRIGAERIVFGFTF